MQMKRLLIGVLLVAFLCTPLQVGFGANSKYKLKELSIKLFDEIVTVDQAMIPRNRYTFVSIADVLKPLGFEMVWDEKKSTMTAKKEKTTIELKVGSRTVYINNIRKRLPMSPKLISKRVFVPLRQVTDLLGFTFETDADNQIRIFDRSNRTKMIITPSKSSGLWWSASNKGKEMYLLLHPSVAFKTIGGLPETISQAFQASGSLHVEANLLAPPIATIQTWITANGLQPPGKTLKDQLSDKQFILLQQTLTQLNMTIEQFETLEPWLCAMLLSQYRAEALQGYQDDFIQFDLSLQELAKKREKLVLEWISAESLLGVYDQMSLDDQLAYLNQVMETKPSTEASPTEAIKKAWLSSDLKTYQSLVYSNTKNASQPWQVYLEERLNRKIADQLIQESKKQSQPIFVLLQPAHVFAKTNVLNLLEKSGYKVNKQ